MKNALALAVLLLVYGSTGVTQTAAARPLGVAPDRLQRVEILYFPERILVRAALSPERLEQLYHYKLEIRDARQSAEWQRLEPLLSETSVMRSERGYDHRIAVLFFDRNGNRIASAYFDAFGRAGTINGVSGTIAGGMYRWAKSLLKGIAE